MTTTYKAVISREENFELWVLKSKKGGWLKEPVLEVFKHKKGTHLEDEVYLWDNPLWLKELYKALKNKNKKSEQYQQFKKFCKKHNEDFKSLKKELLEVFKESKKQNFW